MDGLTLLREAESAGLQVHAEGDKLVVEGPKSAEPIALRLIKHKASVLPLVIGAVAREHAIARWLSENPPEHVDPESCAACGAPLTGRGLPLAVRARGARRGDWRGHVWVCDSAGRCIAAYYQARRAEAEAALATAAQAEGAA